MLEEVLGARMALSTLEELVLMAVEMAGLVLDKMDLQEQQILAAAAVAEVWELQREEVEHLAGLVL